MGRTRAGKPWTVTAVAVAAAVKSLLIYISSAATGAARWRRAIFFWHIPALAFLLVACGTEPEKVVPDSPAAAKQLFDATVRQFHVPAAAARGGERAKLLARAAAGYEAVLRFCPGQRAWAAQALRSLGNVRAEEGRLGEAVRCYERVGAEYSEQRWEVLQAWKTAAEVLQNAGREREARVFYQQIIARFDRPGAVPVVQLAVKGAKRQVSF